MREEDNGLEGGGRMRDWGTKINLRMMRIRKGEWEEGARIRGRKRGGIEGKGKGECALRPVNKVKHLTREREREREREIQLVHMNIFMQLIV